MFGLRIIYNKNKITCIKYVRSLCVNFKEDNQRNKSNEISSILKCKNIYESVARGSTFIDNRLVDEFNANLAKKNKRHVPNFFEKLNYLYKHNNSEFRGLLRYNLTYIGHAKLRILHSYLIPAEENDYENKFKDAFLNVNISLDNIINKRNKHKQNR